MVRIFFVLLIIEIVAEVFAASTHNYTYIFITKPLLMPILIVWVFSYASNNNSKPNKLLIIALSFSLFGDSALMFLPFKPNIFIIGLFCFLITHIIYMFLFIQFYKQHPKKVKYKALLIISASLYGFILLSVLYFQNHPDFNKFQSALIIYSIVILSMLITAFYTNNKLIIIGALLFVLSDTIIAFSKFSYVFVDRDYLARVIIMSLYGVAQFLIVKGYIFNSNCSQRLARFQ